MATFNSAGIEVFGINTSLAYPSANAINGGELNSEENIRNIVTRISTKSFVIKRVPTEDDLDGTTITTSSSSNNEDESFGLSFSNSTLYIAPGECNIRGYYFRSKNQTAINLNDFIVTDKELNDLYINWDTYVTEGSNVTLYVYLQVKKDSSDHILSFTADNLSYSKFRGVVVQFTTEKKSYYDLLLGEISISKSELGFTINSAMSNDHKFIFLDANDIFHLNIEKNDYETLEEYIETLIMLNSNGDIHDNLTIYGDNIDNNTNIILTNESGEKLFRLYYNPTNNTGGLSLHSGHIDSNGKAVITGLIKQLLSFTNLPTSSTDSSPSLEIGANVTIDNNLTVQAETTLNDDVTFNGDVTIGNSNSNNQNVTLYGSINIPSNNNIPTQITENVIQADKVYGAVWG